MPFTFCCPSPFPLLQPSSLIVAAAAVLVVVVVVVVVVVDQRPHHRRRKTNVTALPAPRAQPKFPPSACCAPALRRLRALPLRSPVTNDRRNHHLATPSPRDRDNSLRAKRLLPAQVTRRTGRFLSRYNLSFILLSATSFLVSSPSRSWRRRRRRSSTTSESGSAALDRQSVVHNYAILDRRRQRYTSNLTSLSSPRYQTVKLGSDSDDLPVCLPCLLPFLAVARSPVVPNYPAGTYPLRRSSTLLYTSLPQPLFFLISLVFRGGGVPSQPPSGGGDGVQTPPSDTTTTLSSFITWASPPSRRMPEIPQRKLNRTLIRFFEASFGRSRSRLSAHPD
ncbi:hypothetical protein CGCS363_v014478 [Colletotrichum siamense]|uniref:uncharacterized protein n=1 Tax=Colletotrichum siamense TaxID=690259 RepID=UPI0018726FE3|nr:uncharacterized protein CGCS363_v014478 [Colletotrichum siamense]KAF5485131.1 hypothetical protein CGCS363_v014478 [Colletotrichum siamense]